MLAITHSAVLLGMSSAPVRVEVQAVRGIPAFELVGLAEASVRESRVRVKSALAGVGVDISEYRVTVNMAPADLKKTGSSFDLAIALGTLVALERIPAEALAGTLLLGELSLSGTLQSLRGVVAHLLAAKQRGVARVIVPAVNDAEASLVDDLRIETAESLAEIVASLTGGAPLPGPSRRQHSAFRETMDDLADVRGQDTARHALEVAAAGGHNMLMLGPPGSGKTMLARRLPGILPLLSRDEALEVMAIHGVAGLSPTEGTAVERPFRAPHHTLSEYALVGGGEMVRPGEVSLAHRGVLFLDEMSEMRRPAIEALRQPLEDGFVTVSRMKGVVTFPAQPLLVAASNPCPCGYGLENDASCACGNDKRRAYRQRLSGPILDRIDLHVRLHPVDVRSLHTREPAESTATVRARVEKAREIQDDRYRRREVSMRLNAHLGQRDLDRVCRLDARCRSFLGDLIERFALSARAYTKVLRVARTLADMAGATVIRKCDIAAASGLRQLDRDDRVLRVA